MTNYNDGRIHGWNGGECPVHPETMVYMWFRDAECGKVKASKFTWLHSENCSDIIAFQVVKEHREPKTIWVNEYEDGYYVGYTGEVEAKYYALPSATRIAVKYQEVL